jgi:hypothetical protein
MSGRVRGPGRVRGADNGVARWWWPADLGVLAAMVILGSVVVIPTYGSIAPVLATATGALVAVVVLVGIRRLGVPAAVAVPAIAVGLVLVGSLVVAPELRQVAVLPSPAGMGAVLRGSVGGWRELLSVATPTGVAGTLLVPPLVLGAAGTAIAGWIAAGRRPELAVSIPAGSTVVFALLGDAGVARAAVVLVACGGVVAGVSWVVWVGARVRRRQVARFAGGAAVRRPSTDRSPAARNRRAFTARRTAVAAAVLAAACVVGALTAVAATPDRLALRNVAEPATDPAGFVSPLSTFRSYTGDGADAVQLTVQGLPPGARLRVAALDFYDGRQFSVSDAAGPFVRIGRYRPDSAATGDSTDVAVVVGDYSGPFLPLPGALTELSFTGPRAAALTADLRYSDAAETGLLPGGWQPGDGYSVVTEVPSSPTLQQLAATSVAAQPVPTEIALPEVLRAAAARYVAGVSGAGAQVEAIRAGLAADGLFSHGSPGELRAAAGHGLDRLTAMVSGPAMIGDQEQYAALMALLVRSVGLPARVGVGFVTPPAPDGSAPDAAAPADAAGPADEADPAGGTALRGRDISAWVEVPFAGLGWVAFDPTPAADKPVTAAQDRSQAERRAVSVDVPPALPPGQRDAVDADSAGQRSEPPDGDNPIDQSASGWPMLVLAVLGWSALALLLAAIPVATILAVKRARRRRRHSGDPRSQIAGGWEHLLGVAVDAGYRPTPWHTRTETAADLRADGILRVDWLAPAADAAEFAPVGDVGGVGVAVTQDRATAFWREVDDRSAELLAGLPRWRRWRARVSLASMRRLDRRRGG